MMKDWKVAKRTEGRQETVGRYPRRCSVRTSTPRARAERNRVSVWRRDGSSSRQVSPARKPATVGCQPLWLVGRGGEGGRRRSN